jgi:hypothetical protein
MDSTSNGSAHMHPHLAETCVWMAPGGVNWGYMSEHIFLLGAGKEWAGGLWRNSPQHPAVHIIASL